MKYKNAFKCRKCPEQDGENGCPLWWELVWENDETHQTKIEKGCGLSKDMLPSLMIEVIRSAHGAQEQMSKCQNKVNNFENIFLQGFQGMVSLLNENLERVLPYDYDIKVISNGKEKSNSEKENTDEG